MTNSDKFTLYLSQRSPFARRVRLALTRVGIEYGEEPIEVFDPPKHFLEANPLGLVPTLVGPGGFVLSDSAMIIEWAHSKTGQIFSQGPLEWAERQAVVLCEGVITSTVLFFQEYGLHEVPSPWWMRDHFSALTETLKTVDKMPRELFVRANPDGPVLTQAGWDLAVALEYITLRVPDFNWKALHPAFNGLLELAHQNRQFASTVPVATAAPLIKR